MSKVNDEKLLEKYLSAEKLTEAKEKLAKGYPVQYLIGNVDFYDCLIKVDERVLIPRFETEYLVDDLLKYIKQYQFSNPNILDIGTGSGCISIALKKNIILSNITGIDKSKEAIFLAQENAKLNNVDINFICKDIETFNNNQKYDIIVSNPPYISKDDIVDEKTKYEPQSALFAPDDGIYFYKLILNKSQNLLNKKNIIAFEIGYNQKETIVNLVKKIYPTAIVIAKNDLNGYNRYIYIINE